MPRDDLPAFLIRQQLTTGAALARAVDATFDGGGLTWLEHLLLARAVDEDELASSLALELALPLCDLDRLENASEAALLLIPPDLAAEHRIVPVFVDRDGDVSAAMVDPLDRTALQVIEFYLGRRVLREVATASAIAWALYAHYEERTALWPPRYARAQTSPYLELEIY